MMECRQTRLTNNWPPSITSINELWQLGYYMSGMLQFLSTSHWLTSEFKSDVHMICATQTNLVW